jgi:cobyrinic acid a,c-diamide synthase
MGLLAAWRHQGLSPCPFKKGPDYIDAAWLGWAAGTPCRNLDTFLQPEDRLLDTFGAHASGEGSVNLVEGNRGLFDGLDARGTHSTAALARLLHAPVTLVVGARKVTRTVAAVVLGCKTLEPDVEIAGVVLNRVAGARHEALVRQAVESVGVEVVGAIPRLDAKQAELLPDRHLGLVPVQERDGLEALEERLRGIAERYLDLDRLLAIARCAPELPRRPTSTSPEHAGPRVKIGVFRDSAFTFYYPENLEVLERAGAEIVPISGLSDGSLPEGLGALYLGGGFPETHAVRLAQNAALHAELRRVAGAGMPIYAECGGMIYLARRLIVGDDSYPMAGVLPLELELRSRPQGHGYVEVVVDRENPFFEVGEVVRGHEFHYTRLTTTEGVQTGLSVRRGTGIGGGRDGVVHHNILAAYTHIHAVGVPMWAGRLVEAARRFARR